MTGTRSDPGATRRSPPAQPRRPRPAFGFGVIDVLRFFGLAPRGVPRPVVGPKAFVSWWRRLAAAAVLAAIVVGLGVVLAGVVWVMVLGAGFLLEQAIS